jgi:hypothetical protein
MSPNLLSFLRMYTIEDRYDNPAISLATALKGCPLELGLPSHDKGFVGRFDAISRFSNLVRPGGLMCTEDVA